MTYDLLSRTYDMVTLSRTYNQVSRTYDLVTLSRKYDLVSRKYNLVSRMFDLLSPTLFSTYN